MTNSARSPCVRCGTPLHTGEGRIVAAFSVLELEELAFATRDVRVREPLLCAIGLLDQERDRAVRREMAE